MRIVIPVVLALAQASGHATSSIAADTDRPKEKLSKERVLEIISGNTVRITGTRSKKDFQAFYSSSGEVFLQSGSVTDTGTWEVETSGLLCTRWEKLRGGERSCFDVYLIDGQLWYYVAGTDTPSAGHGDVAPGDPKSLAPR